MTSIQPKELHASLSNSLQTFISSPSQFAVLQTYPPRSTSTSTPSSLPTKTLYVLDSSFNPPSLAHAALARSAITASKTPHTQIRLLLLLATQNADKPSKPASFPDRLVMMCLMAHSLHTQCSGPVDVGVTKLPYFMDKARSIDESDFYGSEQVEQVHLTGYDTILRIFDRKYYPEKEGFAVLEPFLSRHRVRCHVRPSEKWGGVEEQRGYVQKIREGEREHEGIRKEWAGRIEIVDDEVESREIEGVSSTKARECAVEGDWDGVEKVLGREVMEWVRGQKLYEGGDVKKEGLKP